MDLNEIEESISKIPDYPKPGILFYDISTLLCNKLAFVSSIDLLSALTEKSNFELIAGIDARGFIFASSLAYKLKSGLMMIRKKSKLPGKTLSLEYDLEYGKDTLEINLDVKNKKILLVDDLLATGGTANAASMLLEKAGGKVVCFLSLIELRFLKASERLKFPCKSLIKY